MRNKILAGLGAVSAVGLSLFPHLAGAQMSTTTLATQIGNVNQTAYDYLGVVIGSYWPFVLGFMIIIGVLAVGIYFVKRLFNH